MNHTHRMLFAIGLFALCTVPAQAAVKVFTCEAEWATLAQEIGGGNVDAYSATSGQQDPHRIEARPSLIARVRNAELMICTGLELESGWLPVLLQQSGNRSIQPGQPGSLMIGTLVARLEMPSQLDRSQGDVHASGNPHIQLDPRNIGIAATAIAERLKTLDSAHAAEYQTRLGDFQQRWQAALQRWNQQAGPLRGVKVITHHKDFVYLLNWLGMRELGNLEPKPGLEPSSAHLAGLLQQLQQEPAQLVLRTPYQSDSASAWLADQARIPALMLPNTVGGSDAATDLFTLYDDILARLLGGLK